MDEGKNLKDIQERLERLAAEIVSLNERLKRIREELERGKGGPPENGR